MQSGRGQHWVFVDERAHPSGLEVGVADNLEALVGLHLDPQADVWCVLLRLGHVDEALVRLEADDKVLRVEARGRREEMWGERRVLGTPRWRGRDRTQANCRWQGA